MLNPSTQQETTRTEDKRARSGNWKFTRERPDSQQAVEGDSNLAKSASFTRNLEPES